MKRRGDPQIKCSSCESERNSTEPRCLNTTCSEVTAAVVVQVPSWWVVRGYARPNDGLMHWKSASGYKLFCGSALRSPLSWHWEATSPSGNRASGWTPEDALRQVL